MSIIGYFISIPTLFLGCICMNMSIEIEKDFWRNRWIVSAADCTRKHPSSIIISLFPEIKLLEHLFFSTVYRLNIISLIFLYFGCSECILVIIQGLPYFQAFVHISRNSYFKWGVFITFSNLQGASQGNKVLVGLPLNGHTQGKHISSISNEIWQVLSTPVIALPL